MKKICFFILCVIAGSTLHAQLHVPEFKNEPESIQGDSGLGRLEFPRGEPVQQTNAGVPNFMATTNVDYVTYPYPKSPVRLQTSTQFIVKLPDAEVDPEGVFTLVKIVAGKKERVVYTNGAMGWGTASMRVKLDFEKIAPGIYKITPEKLLPKTEYSFVVIAAPGAKPKCYLFGID